MTIIEARYIGSYKTPEWGTWFEWQRYDVKYYADKALLQLRRQFRGLYEFRTAGA
jgi:hypothetical protein